MKAAEIRKRFLEYFVARGHKQVSSSPLIPADDPTLLFTSAGMVQFKEYFQAQSTDNLKYTRAAAFQKCLRAGGKKSDLENVGRTARHQSFFEMLGNFSFGDYFKKEAIDFAWEFSVKEMKIDPERIWATVYLDDDEAYDIWTEYLPEDRIVRLGKADNFWGPAGDTGPCGPSSELYYDYGPEKGCGEEGCAPGCECDRFVEYWNLVFTQYNMDEKGDLVPLKKTNIDKIFIDYQINYKDLLGKKYSVLYTYCILTIKSLKTIESHLSDYRLIIDGIDISHGRRPLIMPYKTIYPNEANNEKDKS